MKNVQGLAPDVIAENLEQQKTFEMEFPVNEVAFASHLKSCIPNLDGGCEIMVKDKPEKVMSGVNIAMCRSSYPLVCDRNPHMWICSENGFEVPPCKDHGPQHPCPTSQEVVVIDDDNNFGCIYPTTSRNSFRTAPCIKGHRIRKILASKNWKVAAKYGVKKNKSGNVPALLDNSVNTWFCSLVSNSCPLYPISFVGGYKRTFNFNKRNSYKNQRSQMNIPFKKRKLFDGCFSNCNDRRIVDKISDSNANARETSGLYLEIMKYFKHELLHFLFKF